MLKNKRKLPAMHYVYGVTETPHKCRECDNLRMFQYRNRRYYKCAAYGISNSEATDWGVNYRACGFFNQPMIHVIPLLEKITSYGNNHSPIPIDGQLSLEDI